MSDESFSDDEIAGLFAEANPIPNPVGHSAADRTNPTRSTVMVDLADPLDHGEPTGPTRRWGVLAAAAAIVVLATGLVFFVLDDTSTPADETGTPTSITAPDTLPPLPSPVTSGPVLDLIDAFNARDADAITALTDSVSALAARDVDDVVAGLDWYDAFDWRWTDAKCESSAPETVQCDLTIRNRLTDYTGVTPSAQILATVDADGIEFFTVREDFDEYGAAALDPFREYVLATSPDDFVAMWRTEEEEEEEHSDRRVALFDTYLTRYTDDAEPPTPVHRAFLEAHADDEADGRDIVGYFETDATISGAWGDEPRSYTDGLAVLSALGFDWGDWGPPSYCRIPYASLQISCLVRPNTALDAADLTLPGQSLSFEIGEEGISAFVAGSIAVSLDSRLAPFYEWIAAEYPADADLLLTEVGGRMSLVFDPSGADRLAELVDEYLASPSD